MAATAALTLAACAGPAGTNGTQTDDEEDAELTEVEWAAKYIPELDSSIVEQACEEGQLSLYHLAYPNELLPLIQTFEATFPCIQVTPFGAPAGPLNERFVAEASAGRIDADIFMTTTPGTAKKYLEEGYLSDWTPPNSANVPDQWKEEGIYYGVVIDHSGVAWNEDMITPEQEKFLEGVKTWEDLPSDLFNGQTGISNIRAGGTTQLPNYFFQDEYGIEFWQKMKDLNNPLVFSAAAVTVEHMVAGEFSLAFYIPGDNAVANAYLNGAPLKWKFPEPGLGIGHSITLTNGGPNPNAGKLFEAWSLSLPGQAEWVENTNLAPMSTEVEDRRSFAKEPWYHLPETYYVPDWDKIAAEIPDLTPKWDAIFGANLNQS